MIVGAELVRYELPFRSPVVVGDGIHDVRSGLLLGLSDDEGRIGWGEAAPLPGWSRESPAGAEVALEGLVRSIDARPRPDAALIAMAAAWVIRVPSACAALDLALLDLASQREGVPLARLLSPGRTPTTVVPVNALIAGRAPATAAASAIMAAEAGFGTFKLKLGDAAPSVDLDRVIAVRDVVGTEAMIRLDAAGRWDVETAISMLLRLEPLSIEYVEDPVAEPDDLTRIAAATGVPVAVDALLARDPDPFAVVAAAAADVFVLKPSAMGGPRVASRVAARVVETGGSVVVTSFLDSAVGLTGAVHLAASLPAGPACGLATSYLFAENIAAPPPVERGSILVPAGPGLGTAPSRRPQLNRMARRERTRP